MSMTVSQLAESTGVSPHTVRYYEKVGLLEPPPRTPSGYRSYTEEAVERLHFIADGQRLGLRLADIKELLEIRDQGQCPCGHTRKLIEERLAQVRQDLRRLKGIEASLRDMVDQTENSKFTWCCPGRGE